MTPTHEQINELAALACGWTEIHFAPRWDSRQPIGVLVGIPNGKTIDSIDCIPDYCADRNALPALWDRVEEAMAQGDYGLYLVQPMQETSIFLVSRVSPLCQTIACLKALEVYPDDWTTPKEETP